MPARNILIDIELIVVWGVLASPGFKDFLKKAGELAKKGMEMVREEMELQALLRDFDEQVARRLTTIMEKHGYKPLRQYEHENHYIAEFSVEELDKVKRHIDRFIMRKFSPKDREKIVNIIPDTIIFNIYYARRTSQPVIFQKTGENVMVDAKLRFIIEKKGFLSRIGRTTYMIDLGKFAFTAEDYIDSEKKEIDYKQLDNYLEEKIKGLGLI